MITLHGFAHRLPELAMGHTRDLRVQWALEEVGLPYRVRGLDLLAGELKREEFGRLSPFQQVPVIEDDGVVLSESGAIVLYLAEKAGKLIPSDLRGRAEVTRWCFAALTTVEPTLMQIAFIDEGIEPGPDAPRRRAFYVELAGRWLGGMQRRLSQVQYLAGAEFTVADILFTTVLQIADAGVVAPYPALVDYRRRCEARPAWQRTLDDYERRLNLAPGAARR
jgi:glutathione S-transferase